MILVLGGTKEAHELCDYLIAEEIEFYLSVATDYAIDIFKDYDKYMIVGKLDKNGIINFCEKNNVDLIVDITHPYAFMVSQNAIEAASEMGISYLRYERQSSSAYSDENIYYVETHEEAIKLAVTLSDKIFLTVGSNNADIYAPYNQSVDIFIRILPKSDLVKKCEDLGFKNSNIIAMQGPFSKALNKAMLTSTNAGVLITKESGNLGGFMDKLEACIELDVKLIVVQRPIVNYPLMFNDIEVLKRVIREK